MIKTWQDENGFLRAVWIPDNRPDLPISAGVPVGADLSEIDWQAVHKEIHNLLIERGLIDWNDVQHQQTGVTSAILSVLKPKIIQCFRKKP